MATPAELEAKIKLLDWNGLRALWTAIQAGTPPGWEGGEALEYLVIRTFEIDPLEPAVVRYPYEVSLFEETVEEIDGAISLAGAFLPCGKQRLGKERCHRSDRQDAQPAPATASGNRRAHVLQESVYEARNLPRPLHDAAGDLAVVGI